MANLFSIIVGAGTVQGCFLAALLLIRKEGNRNANRILAALLVAFSLNIAHAAFIREIFQPAFLGERRLFEPFQLLFGPLIYLYTRAHASSKFEFCRKDWIHFLPFVLLMCTAAPYFVFVPENVWSTSKLIRLLFWGGLFIHIGSYLGVSIRLALRHDHALRFEYSSTLKGEMKWIRVLLALFLTVSFFYFALFVWMIHGESFPQIQKTVALVLSVTVYGLGFGGLLQTPAVIHVLVPAQIGASDDVPICECETSSVPSEEAVLLLQRVTEFTEREKPYLDPEITLPMLAERIGMPRNQLSQLLNESLGKNFYDFINGYRVKEFQRLVAEPRNAGQKLLTLAMDAGFNSKPTFNLVFKKTTGLTPSEYRAKVTKAS